ncbi:HEAT repeat domain-containing protein [Saccharothrix xinjiangensis]
MVRRLRERLGRLSAAAHPADGPSSEPPDPGQVDRAVAGVVAGEGDAVDGLASLLLVVGGRGDADLIAHTARALAAADSRMWFALDVAARRSPWNTPRWADTAARRLAAGHAGPLETLLAACHPDGFVREAAVAALDERDEAGALPVLALRAADWVPEVRDRARRACGRQLDRAPGEAITSLAPVALALRARQGGRWLAGVVDDVLRDGPPEALAAALAAGDRRTRRLAHTVGLDAGRLDVDRLVRAAKTDADLPIRVMCADAAIRAAKAVGDHDVPRQLLASGTAAVRAEAVRALAAAGEVDPATGALTDRSALVRATAQALVRRAGTDPATRYRALLAGRPPRPPVIAGLGETGTRSDTAALVPCLAHPSSRGRVEAVRALRRLGHTCPEPLLPLLTDPVSSVTRQVVLSLLRQPGTPDEHHLRPLLHRSHPPHVQWAAYRLLRAQGTWTRISVDLELVNDPGHVVHANARADLANWLAQDAATSYSTPSGPRADELSALLARARPVLGPEQARVLRFHLGLTA